MKKTAHYRQPPSRGKSHRSTETKKELIRTALEVFARDGYERATIDAIAQSAGFTKGAVYWHFHDKPTLFTEVVSSVYTELDGVILSEITLKDSLVEKVITAPVVTLQYYMQRKDFEAVWRILVAHGVQDHTLKIGKKFQNDYRRYKDLLRALISRGVQDGKFRRVDIDAVAVLIGSISDGLMFHWILTEDHAPPASVLPTVIEMLHEYLSGEKVSGAKELQKYLIKVKGTQPAEGYVKFDIAWLIG